MDIIVIGAGAAGLMAARELAKAGNKITILEARDRIGGRIHTLPSNGSGITCEGGAEFIHGNLEVTINLLKEAGLKYRHTSGGFYNVSGGEWKQDEDFFEDSPKLIKRLKNLKDNISVTDFLEREFPEKKYDAMKSSLLSYIEGYYSGDPKRTSALSFYNEWQSEDEEQFRPTGGYGNMIQYLADECKQAGALMHLSNIVKEIRWHKGHVEILDEFQHSYTAHKVIVSIPLGVWNVAPGDKGAITFTPALPEKIKAAKQMGFGNAIKILLRFKQVFWEDPKMVKSSNKGGKFSFVFADAPIGTWWSQLPEHVPLLTGWIAGPKAIILAADSNETLLQKAIQSLSMIFKVDEEVIKGNLEAWHIFNWVADPFTRGSYAYSTVETKEARKVLMAPVENTLFFAGEALYDGPEMGTVEAALISGLRVAKEVMQVL